MVVNGSIGGGDEDDGSCCSSGDSDVAERQPTNPGLLRD